MDQMIIAAADAGVRQLQARYADACWRLDADALGQGFAADAVWQLSSGAVYAGRPAIAEAMRAGFANYRHIFITFGTPILAVDGSTAEGRTYVSEQGVFANGAAYLVIGTYYERFAREADGSWRFAWRRFEPGYSGPPGLLPEGFRDMPDYGPPPALPEAR
jgi:ketosteroid isomerase-like protein